MKSSFFHSMLSALLLMAGSFATAALPPVTGESGAVPTRLSQTGRDPDQFNDYVEQLKARARHEGISEATVDRAFTGIHFVDRVIYADRNQPEKKVTLDDYLKKVMPLSRIKRAKALSIRHRSTLEKVSARYGVQSSYIVALWALESNFGTLQGKEDIFSSLATLAFEGRREVFFTSELISALRMVDDGHIDAARMKSSWAGAMGQNQFMPGSYLRYGADGDGDGKIDIWKNTDDVFASTARYLSTEGWQKNAGWGVEVTLPEGFDSSLAGIEPSLQKSVLQWTLLGVAPLNQITSVNAQSRAWIVMPDDMQGRSFMVFDNFQTLMHWNRSYYFAVSVGMLADAISHRE